MVLLGILDFVRGNDPESWVSLPRFHHQYMPDEISAEPDAFTPEQIEGLKAGGAEFAWIETMSAPDEIRAAAQAAFSHRARMNSLAARGTSVVASSGNNGLADQIGMPACIANAVAVGAVYDVETGRVRVLDE